MECPREALQGRAGSRAWGRYFNEHFVLTSPKCRIVCVERLEQSQERLQERPGPADTEMSDICGFVPRFVLIPKPRVRLSVIDNFGEQINRCRDTRALSEAGTAETAPNTPKFPLGQKWAQPQQPPKRLWG